MMMSGKMRDDPAIIKGLDSGADEYLFKPFNSKILYAKIRALLRREPETKTPKMQIGGLLIDTVHRQVWQGQKEILLTKKEFGLFEYLAYHPNVIITRTELEQHAWNLELDSSSNLIDVHIKNLRQKLGDSILIETVRGAGYKLKS